jgi:hypothetical protein
MFGQFVNQIHNFVCMCGVYGYVFDLDTCRKCIVNCAHMWVHEGGPKWFFLVLQYVEIWDFFVEI